MNIIAVTGNSTKNIEIKKAGSTSIASGTIAVRRDFKNQQTGEYETDFINFTAFGKTGEIMEQYIKKGDKFGINGRLQIRKYEQNGENKYFTEVVVNGFDFPDKKSGGNSNHTTLKNDEFTNNSGPIDVGDDDLPF